MDEEIGASGHLVFPQVRHNELLPVQLVRAFDTAGNHRMALGSIAADDEDQIGLLEISDRTRIAPISHSAEQAGRGRRLAVARAVVDIVGADYSAGQLLHQVALFIRALGRRDERHRVWTAFSLDLRQFVGHEAESFVPRGWTKLTALANERRGEAILAIDVTPAELSFHAGRNSVGGAVLGCDFENVAILRPDVEAASHAAIRANRFRLADAVLPHSLLRLAYLEYGAIANLGFNALDHVDHAAQSRLFQRS